MKFRGKVLGVSRRRKSDDRQTQAPSYFPYLFLSAADISVWIYQTEIEQKSREKQVPTWLFSV